MQNISTNLTNGILTITIDTAQNIGPSKSGKTLLVATTSGNKTIPTPNGDVVIGVNCYRKQ